MLAPVSALSKITHEKGLSGCSFFGSLFVSATIGIGPWWMI